MNIPSTSNGSVLIADADWTIQRLFSAIAWKNDFRPVLVTDGTAALLRAATEDFDVILLDLKLPHTDGFEVLRVLASVMPHLLPRVIVVTAADDDVIRNCRTLELVWKVLRKPAVLDELELELVSCHAARLRAARKPPHRATHEDLSFPIHRIAN
jgi:DNA-binding response OmpR family regulator